MKKNKLFLLLFLTMIFLSCSEGVSSIEKHMVVEQIEATKQKSYPNSLEKTHKYRVKIKSYSGEVYYYTNYKHEVGDTLVSIFEFTDNRENIIKQKEMLVDSLSIINKTLSKKNNELTIYNELLMGIIQENAKK